MLQRTLICVVLCCLFFQPAQAQKWKSFLKNPKQSIGQVMSRFKPGKQVKIPQTVVSSSLSKAVTLRSLPPIKPLPRLSVRSGTLINKNNGNKLAYSMDAFQTKFLGYTGFEAVKEFLPDLQVRFPEFSKEQLELVKHALYETDKTIFGKYIQKQHPNIELEVSYFSNDYPNTFIETLTRLSAQTKIDFSQKEINAFRKRTGFGVLFKYLELETYLLREYSEGRQYDGPDNLHRNIQDILSKPDFLDPFVVELGRLYAMRKHHVPTYAEIRLKKLQTWMKEHDGRFPRSLQQIKKEGQGVTMENLSAEELAEIELYKEVQHSLGAVAATTHYARLYAIKKTHSLDSKVHSAFWLKELEAWFQKTGRLPQLGGKVTGERREEKILYVGMDFILQHGSKTDPSVLKIRELAGHYGKAVPVERAALCLENLKFWLVTHNGIFPRLKPTEDSAPGELDLAKEVIYVLHRGEGAAHPFLQQIRQLQDIPLSQWQSHVHLWQQKHDGKLPSETWNVTEPGQLTPQEREDMEVFTSF